jgi:hypothetical protein
MKYAVEVGSVGMMYIPSFIKIGSGIQKLIGESDRHRQHEDLISILQESGLRMYKTIILPTLMLNVVCHFNRLRLFGN